MWMMDCSIAYGTTPETGTPPNLDAIIQPESSLKQSVPVVSDNPEDQMPKLMNVLKEKSVEAVEFLHSEETTQKINAFKEKAASTVSYANAFVQDIAQKKEDDFSSDGITVYKRQQPIVLYIIIGILVLILIIMLILFGAYIQNHQTYQEAALESVTNSENTMTSIQTETVPDTKEPAPQNEPETIPELGVLLSNGTGTSSDKINQDFYQILKNSDAPAGYLYDIDHDGDLEMILKDIQNMQFVLYNHNESGDLYMYPFGIFLAWADDYLYDVTGSNNMHYLYYRDDYNQTSAQGYYDPSNDHKLDIGILYEANQAEWAIFYNDSQVDTGTESVSDIYAQPAKCHTSLMNQLKEYGFQIKDNSIYTRITMMNYNELCHETGGVELVPETVPVTEPAPTVPATEAKQPPEINCEIQTQGSEMYDGYSYTLYVSGKYDYYYIECYEYGEGSPNDAYLVLSGNKSDSSLYLTAGSSLDRVTVSVTPYYSDGTKGKTVSCTKSQPAPKVTSVPMPSSCMYMGTGTPVSGDGFLNLRSSKSTSSDSNIITQIPNGASISMYSINDSSWIYVEYGSYSGYVKESYTKLTDPQGLWADGPGDDEYTSVSTESCYAVGEINGTSVSGYTTSYVVDGGPKSKVRDRLGDGWHVTAYATCYSHGITWYEVYDTDDGDYYGWVSSYCITFYGG